MSDIEDTNTTDKTETKIKHEHTSTDWTVVLIFFAIIMSVGAYYNFGIVYENNSGDSGIFLSFDLTNDED